MPAAESLSRACLSFSSSLNAPTWTANPSSLGAALTSGCAIFALALAFGGAAAGFGASTVVAGAAFGGLAGAGGGMPSSGGGAGGADGGYVGLIRNVQVLPSGEISGIPAAALGTILYGRAR